MHPLVLYQQNLRKIGPTPLDLPGSLLNLTPFDLGVDLTLRASARPSSPEMLTWKTNDRRPYLTYQLLQTDNSVSPPVTTPVDLTGSTVTFFMANASGVLKVTAGPCTITDAINGKVKYAWLAADTNTAGSFQGEFEVTYADNTQQTFPNDGTLRLQFIAELG